MTKGCEPAGFREAVGWVIPIIGQAARTAYMLFIREGRSSCMATAYRGTLQFSRIMIRFVTLTIARTIASLLRDIFLTSVIPATASQSLH
ncbi:hypothetical protein WK62_15715 [Burkholderia ubonensis]|nr:hypothetical protein WK62_15715 [Burkholderia ubonensis]